MRKNTFEEKVDKKVSKLKEKFNVPEWLEEDFRQEVAVAFLVAEERYPKPETPGDKFYLWRRSTFVDRYMVRFIENETNPYHGLTVVSAEDEEIAESIEAKRETQNIINLVQKHMDDMIEELLTTTVHNPTSVERYRVILDVMYSNDQKDESFATIKEIARQIGVSYQTGRGIHAKFLRIMRHPTRARKLQDFCDIFEALRDLEDSII